MLLLLRLPFCLPMILILQPLLLQITLFIFFFRLLSSLHSREWFFFTARSICWTSGKGGGKGGGHDATKPRPHRVRTTGQVSSCFDNLLIHETTTDGTVKFPNRSPFFKHKTKTTTKQCYVYTRLALRICQNGPSRALLPPKPMPTSVLSPSDAAIVSIVNYLPVKNAFFQSKQPSGSKPSETAPFLASA